MSAAANTDGSGFESQGAHHQTQNFRDPSAVQEPTRQGHEEHMGITEGSAPVAQGQMRPRFSDVEW